MMKRCPTVIEHDPKGCNAYSPGLPGCVAAVTSEEEFRTLMTEAIEFHIQGLKLHGQTVREPTTSVNYITVAA
jgi:predicted RNase H-like HicB family nuclease